MSAKIDARSMKTSGGVVVVVDGMSCRLMVGCGLCIVSRYSSLKNMDTDFVVVLFVEGMW